MNHELTAEHRADCLKWVYMKPQTDKMLEAERIDFLRDFSVPVVHQLLEEVENWPVELRGPEPGLVAMQRWFRLIRLKMEGAGELKLSGK